MSKIEEAIKDKLNELSKVVAFLKTADDTYSAGEDIEKIKQDLLNLLESEPEPTELTTLARRFLPPKEAFAQVEITDVSEQPGQLELICHKLCKEIDRLTAENAKQKQLIELIEYAVSRRGHYE